MHHLHGEAQNQHHERAIRALLSSWLKILAIFFCNSFARYAAYRALMSQKVKLATACTRASFASRRHHLRQNSVKAVYVEHTLGFAFDKRCCCPTTTYKRLHCSAR